MQNIIGGCDEVAVSRFGMGLGGMDCESYPREIAIDYSHRLIFLKFWDCKTNIFFLCTFYRIDGIMEPKITWTVVFYEIGP